MNCLPGLASNSDPPELCLLSSWDYRRGPQAPNRSMESCFCFSLYIFSTNIPYPCVTEAKSRTLYKRLFLEIDKESMTQCIRKQWERGRGAILFVMFKYHHGIKQTSHPFLHMEHELMFLKLL
jgi:hypothetical protein